MTGFRSLSEFLSHLERRGDLLRVSREVDWAHEVTEIACREAKAEGPALLFEKVRGSQFPLAVNVLAARRRIEAAIGRTSSARSSTPCRPSGWAISGSCAAASAA